MEECDLHELSGCTICSGKFTTKAKPAKPSKPRKAKPPVAADLALAESVAAGKTCPYCLTPMAVPAKRYGETPMGCQCSRRERYEVGTGDARMWLKDNEEAFLAGKADAGKAISVARKTITGIAFSMTTRASRRAGLSTAELQEDRLEILQALAVEPTWHAARNQEGNHLPV